MYYELNFYHIYRVLKYVAANNILILLVTDASPNNSLFISLLPS